MFILKNTKEPERLTYGFPNIIFNRKDENDMSNYNHLSALLEGYVKRGLPGCGCAVAKDGRILYEGYYGYADLEEKKPINEDSVYRIFSMTKVIICTAAMILYERGKFLLSDPLYEYFPEYKETNVFVKDENGNVHVERAKNPMLVKHAFTMAVGMPYTFGNYLTAKEIEKARNELKEKYGKFDIVTEVKRMGSIPVEFEPGTVGCMDMGMIL